MDLGYFVLFQAIYVAGFGITLKLLVECGKDITGDVFVDGMIFVIMAALFPLVWFLGISLAVYDLLFNICDTLSRIKCKVY